MSTDIEQHCAEQKKKGKVTVRILPVAPVLRQRLASSPERDKDWNLEFRVQHEGQTFEVAYGNPWERRTRDSCTVYVLDENRRLRDLRICDFLGDAVIVEGYVRSIYFPPLPFCGKSSLMGGIGHSIKSGKCFRGR